MHALSDEKFLGLFEDSPEAILVTDPTGRVTDANPTACRMLGWARDRLLPLPWADVLVDGRREVGGGLDGGTCGEQGGRTRTCVRADGTRVEVEMHTLPIRGDPSPGVFVVFRERSGGRPTEEPLRQSSAELRRASEDFQRFAYAASHDLQEPLRTVTGFLSLLRDRYHGKLDAKADQYISFSCDGAERMSAMIKALLDFSRVSNKALEPVSVDFSQALGEAQSALWSAIQGAQAVITAEGLPTTKADASLMVRLLKILIDNAVKFRRAGVAPLVHVAARKVIAARTERDDGAFPAVTHSPGSHADTGDHWLFTVRDNGIGVDPAQAKRLFVIFQRLHSREEYAGSGVGLAIARNIVERHGGRIWVESSPGEGATFCFTLPTEDTLRGVLP